jgi:SAM-dependent methyltransferase
VSSTVIWHDIECGSYRQDIALWLALAREHGGPVLDVGAGTGRVSLELARAGYDVTALDLDGELVAELSRRGAGLPIETVVADARDFDLGRRYALCIVPMQTVQLLGGAAGRGAFLRRAAAHVADGGVIAIAIATELELFEVHDGEPAPLPDVCELDGFVYCSQATAVRRDRDAFVLERRRETVSPAGERDSEDNVIRLDRVSAGDLAREAAAAGLTSLGVRRIEQTEDHVGSEVVLLGV